MELTKHKKVRITDVAELERAKKNKIYEKGCTLIQISATDGQVVYLEKTENVAEKYLVVIPKKNKVIDYYLYLCIYRSFPKFFHRIKTGLNIQAETIKEFEFNFHEDMETQQYLADMLQELEYSIRKCEQSIDNVKTMKEYFSKTMFV